MTNALAHCSKILFMLLGPYQSFLKVLLGSYLCQQIPHWKNAPTYYCQTINNNNRNGFKKFYKIGTGIFLMLLDVDASLWRHEIQHNDTQQSDTQHS
jgi:hypothetical protein